MADCSTGIQYLKGVGPTYAKRFKKLGILTLGDLLEHYPRRYIDYTHPYTISQAPYDTACCIIAEVVDKSGSRRLPGGRTLCRVLAMDDTAQLTLSWFNAPYAADKLVIGERYCFEGLVGGSLLQRTMINPVVRTPEQVQACPLQAVYSTSEGLNSSYIARCMRTAIDCVETLPEPLPEDMRRRYRLPDKCEAVRAIHFPKNTQAAADARRRLIFEELLTLQLGILLLRGRSGTPTCAPMKAVDTSPFLNSLPFSPTGAQQRAAAEICSDMTRTTPMNRLLQGDVGSGKTLVAAIAAWFAAQNGYQCALMAPTEILARQHAKSLADLLEPFGVGVALLTGGMKAAEKRHTLSAIADGRAGLVVGTHAVITDAVQFSRLGLAIVDEQHRFGVRQRSLLAGKARQPHLLVMSATPIPRTLGLLLYGDLDISILDELPPGRTPVKTWFINGKKRLDMYGWLAKQLADGHQAYIVCPAIERSADDGIQSAKKYYEETAIPLLPGHRVGLMHGKLRPAEKNAVMEQFQKGEIEVLVSTTVIEVGVDVPNATVMVIENAERFGLSALHQLRGRVGRGSAESCCILVSDHKGENVRRRLQFLCHTTDGFAIARYDLETRGPGDFFGQAQHGLPRLHIADLMTDTRPLAAAQAEAQSILHEDPLLALPAHRGLSDQVARLFADAGAMN